MSNHRPRLGRIGLVTILAVLLVGCGGPDDDPADGPTADDAQPPTDEDANGAAGGTTMQVLTVPEATSSDAEGSVHVSGLLIDDGSGWRLCESVLESQPPQCGGQALTVEGLDPTDLPIEEQGDVRWQTDATVVGEIDGERLVVTGSPAAS